MKKSSIALGVAALMAGATAQAGFLDTGVDTRVIEVNPHGIGHKLVVPYFTVQNNNVTLLNIVNHDRSNGKAVKVRFRGAANSDDIFDFTLFLSPGDVWTAAVTRDNNGNAQLKTFDKSCTLPKNVNQSFTTQRLDSKSTKSLAEQTREGYVEIINMADIPATLPPSGSTNSLFTAIKHVNGVAPCGAAVNNLATATIGDAITLTTSGPMTSAGFDFPTTGLSADWIILNQQTTAAWSGSALALEVRSGAAGAATTGNFVFFSQSNDPVNRQTARSYTADPLLTRGHVDAARYDFPDLSTPYVGTDAISYRDMVSNALAKTSLANEFVTDPSIAGMTDLVMTQPTRRYYAAVHYDDNASIIRNPDDDGGVYNEDNTKLESRVLCVNDKVVSYTAYNREETEFKREGAVISPSSPKRFWLCGEAAVTSINAGSSTAPSALYGSLTRNNIDLITESTALVDGWIRFNFAPALPVIGNAHLRAANGAVNYGFTWPHKYNMR